MTGNVSGNKVVARWANDELVISELTYLSLNANAFFVLRQFILIAYMPKLLSWRCVILLIFAPLLHLKSIFEENNFRNFWSLFIIIAATTGLLAKTKAASQPNIRQLYTIHTPLMHSINQLAYKGFQNNHSDLSTKRT